MAEPTQREFKLKLPMRFRTSKKKVTALNLNVYRNLHYRTLTALKHKAQDHGKKLLREAKVPPLGRIRLRYQVFIKIKRELDISNVCSIVDKFFSDTLQYAGIIEDDNWKFIDDVSFGFGGLSTEEHVLVTITEIEPRKGNAMRILLDEDEIQKALEDFVATLGLSGVTGVDLNTDDDGNITAEVLMGEAKAKPKTKRGGRQPGSKNKPKEPTEDVDVSGEDSDAGDGTGDAESAEVGAPADKADTPSKAGNSSSKNLFGDEETESSASDSPEEAEDTPTPTRVKKSSIFDQ